MFIGADRSRRLQNHPTITTVNDNTRVGGSGGRVLQEIVHGLQMMWQKNIVGIQESNELPNRSIDSEIARRGATLVFLPQETKATISDPFDDLCRVIRR